MHAEIYRNDVLSTEQTDINYNAVFTVNYNNVISGRLQE